jgi:hypothetical protein
VTVTDLQREAHLLAPGDVVRAKGPLGYLVTCRVLDVTSDGGAIVRLRVQELRNGQPKYRPYYLYRDRHATLDVLDGA